MLAFLAASDVPNARAIIFGAVAVAVTGVVVAGIWKLLGYATRSTLKAALADVLGDEFREIRNSLDHLHECFERRLGAVEARETSAKLHEMRRIADAVVGRLASPARHTDPPGADFLTDRALPPSEAAERTP